MGLARASSALLVVVHVADPLPWSLRDDFQIAPSMIQDLADSEQAQLARWQQLAKTLGAREVATRYLTGTPWDQITTLTQDDHTIDLVVMGTHGRTGLAHALLGSVAEKVVRHARCPVLVVRSREPRG
jgi:nucleotide-binding universal stress UspA family protein